jgi:hypothetical protein
MGKRKTESTSNSSFANQMGFSEPYSSPDIDAYREFRPQVDPSIPYRYGAQRSRIMSTYANPTGSYATPELQEQRQASSLGDLTQAEGQAQREAQFDVNQQRGAQLGTLAGLTRPNFYQLGGTSTGKGTQVQSGGFLGDLLLGALSGAASNPKI